MKSRTFSKRKQVNHNNKKIFNKDFRSSVPANKEKNTSINQKYPRKSTNAFSSKGEPNLLSQLKYNEKNYYSTTQSKPMSQEANKKLKRLEMILGIRDDSVTLKPNKSQNFLTDDGEKKKEKKKRKKKFSFKEVYQKKNNSTLETAKNKIYRGSLDRSLVDRRKNGIDACLDKKFLALSLKKKKGKKKLENSKHRKGKVYSSTAGKDDPKSKRRVVPFGSIYKEKIYSRTAKNHKNGYMKIEFKNKWENKSESKKPVKAKPLNRKMRFSKRMELNKSRSKIFRDTNLTQSLNFKDIKLEFGSEKKKDKEKSTDCDNTPRQKNNLSGIYKNDSLRKSKVELSVEKDISSIQIFDNNGFHKSSEILTGRGKKENNPPMKTMRSEKKFKMFKARFLNMSGKKSQREDSKEKNEFQNLETTKYRRLKNSLKLPNILFTGNNYYSKDMKICYKPKNENLKNFMENPKFKQNQISKGNLPKNRKKFKENFHDLFEAISMYRELRPQKIGDLNRKRFRLKDADPEKSVLVLDMDETLLHAKFLVGPRKNSIELELEPGRKFHVI